MNSIAIEEAWRLLRIAKADHAACVALLGVGRSAFSPTAAAVGLKPDLQEPHLREHVAPHFGLPDYVLSKENLNEYRAKNL